MKKGWRAALLGELCTIRPPKREARSKCDDDAIVSFVPMEDLGQFQRVFAAKQAKRLSEVYGGYTYFADNDVLLAKITPCFENGKLSVASDLSNGVGFGSSEFMVLRCGELLNPHYLFYFLSRDEIREAGKGAMTGAVGHKRVPNEFVQSLSIPVPPLEEQKRIVAILDEAFEGLARARENTEANLSDALNLFCAFQERVLAKFNCSPQVQLGEHVDLLSGFAFKSREYSHDPNDVRLLRGDNIAVGSLRWANAKFWPKANIRKYERYQLKVNDVLLAMDRTWIAAGMKYAVVSEADTPSLLVQRVARLRALPTLSADFLTFLVSSKAFERYVRKIQTGLGVPHISGDQIKAFKFSLPSISDQKCIVQQLEKVGEAKTALETQYSKTLEELSLLRRSLLNRAFSGELT